MERSWHTRRLEGINTPLHWQFGITEQSLLRVKHGVCLGDSVPEQPRLSSHVPSASMPSTTRQNQRMPLLLIISTTSPGLYSVNGLATVLRLFSFHFMPKRSIALVMSSRMACQVVHCTSHRVQIISPAKMLEHLTLVFQRVTR